MLVDVIWNKLSPKIMQSYEFTDSLLTQHSATAILENPTVGFIQEERETHK